MTNWMACSAVESAPEWVSGACAFVGSRAPVSALFENLACGATMEEFLDWFPGVQAWHVRAGLDHESEVLETPLN